MTANPNNINTEIPFASMPLDSELCNIYEFSDELCQNGAARIPGYFAVSTAPIDVDSPPERRFPGADDFKQINGRQVFRQVDGKPEYSAHEQIKRIARHLADASSKLEASESPELIVSIHGFNVSFGGAQDWYSSIYQYINAKLSIAKPARCVYLGYRWPSESVKRNLGRRLKEAFFRAMPRILQICLIGALVTLVIVIWSISALPYWLYVMMLVVTITLTATICTLVLLRLVAYFRDNYRAINYGVPDLVEVIRQIDQEFFTVHLLQRLGLTEEAWEEKTEVEKVEILDNQEEKVASQLKRIKLNFIGHSLGCLVVTNAVRILSDVFDARSIGTLNTATPGKTPSPLIGRVFSLGRLVLVAPDIPVETIIPRRANFLRSSMRRFEEAYIFSNEGDLALRFASTIANYISFPALTRTSGYRLGNITVKHFQNERDRVGKWDFSGAYARGEGIVNLKPQQDGVVVEPPFTCLEIRSSVWRHNSLQEIISVRKSVNKKAPYSPEPLKFTETSLPIQDPLRAKPVANLFTYFDCTDYKDYKEDIVEGRASGQTAEANQPQGIVTQALKNPTLSAWQYLYLPFSNIDTHGGYFDGRFSKQLIYQLAFTGFCGMLNSCATEPQPTKQNLAQDAIQDTGQDTVQDAAQDQDWRLQQLDRLSEYCWAAGIQVVLAPERYEIDILEPHKPRDRSDY